MDLELCNILMVIDMREIGWEVKNMDREHMFTLMEPSIRENGRMIIRMDKEYFIM